MNAHPYWLLPQPRLDALAAQLAPALQALAARWRDGGSAGPLALAAVDAAALPTAPARYLVRAGEQWLALCAPERSWRALAAGWLDCDVDAGSELANALCRVFCGELFQALGGRDAHLEEHVPRSAWPLPARLTGAGVLRAGFAIDGQPLTLVTAAALWPSLLAPARPAPPLQPCSRALGATRVRLRVALPTASVPLTALAMLAVGDFLNLNLGLDGEVRLQGDGVALSLPASIGRSGDRKAVRITSVQPEPLP